MIDIKSFLYKNKNKRLTLQVWLYAAYYRFCIYFIPMKNLRKYFGKEGEETSLEISEADLIYAKTVSLHVERSASNTPWESKCLVRALTAQKLLVSHNIPCTLYLGVARKDEKMIAHAWVRAGFLYVTGGNGSEYATVAKYCKIN